MGRRPALVLFIFLCVLALLAFISCGGGDGGDTIFTNPSPPAYLEADPAASTQIDLSWMASPDDDGDMQYKVYRDGAHVATVAGTSFSDTGLGIATQYCYMLTAYNVWRKESAYTEEVCATTLSVTRIYGDGSGQDIGVVSDGGLIIAGSNCTMSGADCDVYLIKTDQDGEDQWSKTFGGSDNDYGYSVIEASDGGLVIAGSTYSYGAGSSDFYLIKTDQVGNGLWSKTYGGSDNDFGRSVIETSDGGLVIAGYSRSFGALDYDAYLVKTDQDGNELWSKTYSQGSNREYVYSVIETSDGGLVVVGKAYVYGPGNEYVYLLRTDQDGNELWSKTYGGSTGSAGQALVETPDGGFVLACTSGTFTSIREYLIKTDQDGNELWSKTFGPGSLYDVISTEGDLVFTGASADFTVDLIKTDQDGNGLWFQSYGEYGSSSTGTAVVRSPDGGYAITGTTTSKVFLIKTDSEGNMQ